MPTKRRKVELWRQASLAMTGTTFQEIARYFGAAT